MDEFIEHYQDVVSDGAECMPMWMMNAFDGLFMLAIGSFCLPMYCLGLIVRSFSGSNNHE